MTNQRTKIFLCVLVNLFFIFMFSPGNRAAFGSFPESQEQDYAADIVPDRRIDGLDLIELSHDMVECGPGLSNNRADLNGDGCLDESDVEMLSRHFGRLVTTERPVIGTYNYYWYFSGQQNWPGTVVQPLLGFYDSRNSTTTRIQNEWKNRSGLDLDIISWDGGLAYDNFQHGYQQNPENSRRYFYLYETELRLGPCAGVDLGVDGARTEAYDIFVTDFETMSSDLQQPEYYRIDGRPVIMIWVTACYRGDLTGAIREVRQRVRNLIGIEPFLIGDEFAFNGWDNDLKLERIELFDGITSYGFYNPEYATLYENVMSDGYLADMEAALRTWLDVIEGLRNSFSGSKLISFLPAFPGFRVDGSFPPLYASPEQFQKQLVMLAKIAAEYSVGGIYITSFNEHYEDTAIEPTVERGFERLQIVRSTFGLAPDYRNSHELTCNGDMITVDDYAISRYECPNRAGRLPYTYVNWFQAAAICANSGTGYRLCSEAEWIDACDGVVGEGGSTYPYGNDFVPGTCNDDEYYATLLPAGSLPGCVSAFGVADMSGNVGEFVSDAFPGDSIRKMNKGGTWHQDKSFTSCTSRWKNTPDYSFAEYGFRCCADSSN